MTYQFYPIKFKPILKETIWGGKKLKHNLNKLSTSENLGESWEISSVPNNISVITNGDFAGTNLEDLIKQFKSSILGEKNYKRFGTNFPLLIKFIDAKHDLSIQLHPNNTLAKKRHNSFGKTEMWYVLQADTKAKLIVGFNQPIDKQTYLQHLKAKTLPKILNYNTVKPGDAYFIEAGTVHAIGAGILLAEIQQTSDITYRVYDWDRKDTHGNLRELHNDMAIDAINFNDDDNYKLNYNKDLNTTNKVVACPYFTTNFIDLTTSITKTNTVDSFIIYMCVYGHAEIIAQDKHYIINYGETILLPAALKTYQLKSNNTKLLEIYV